MNATTSRNASRTTTDTINPTAHVYLSASALLASAAHLLRRIGISEASNDHVAVALVDIERIASVMSGRAVTMAHEPLPTTVAPAVSMPEFNHPDNDVATSAGDTAAPPAKCKLCDGAGKRKGKPCPKCMPPVVKGQALTQPAAPAVVATPTPVAPSAPVVKATPAADVVVTQAANKGAATPVAPKATPAPLTTSKGATRPTRGGNYIVMAKCSVCAKANTKLMPFSVAEPTVDHANFKCSACADAAAKPVKAGNTSAVINPAPKATTPAAPVVATQSTVKAAPSPAAPKASPTPTPTVAKPATVPANASNDATTTLVNNALSKGSLGALALACKAIGVATKGLSADAMRQALTTWLTPTISATVAPALTVAEMVAVVEASLEIGTVVQLADAVATVGLDVAADSTADDMSEALMTWLIERENDDVNSTDDDDVAPAPLANVATPAVKASKPKAAPKAKRTSASGLPMNQWRMLVELAKHPGSAFTYRDLCDLIAAEHGTDYYSGATAALNEKHEASLTSLGYTMQGSYEHNGRSNVIMFSITDAGLAFVNEHSNG